jgi:hypothetical protein
MALPPVWARAPELEMTSECRRIAAAAKGRTRSTILIAGHFARIKQLRNKRNGERLGLCGRGRRKRMNRLGVCHWTIGRGLTWVDQALGAAAKNDLALYQIGDLAVGGNVPLRIEQPFSQVELNVRAPGYHSQPRAFRPSDDHSRLDRSSGEHQHLVDFVSINAASSGLRAVINRLQALVTQWASSERGRNRGRLEPAKGQPSSRCAQAGASQAFVNLERRELEALG